VIVSSGVAQDRVELMFSLCQPGRLGSLFPDDNITPYPLKKLDQGARVPRGGVVVLHGKDDTVAPIEQSYTLRKKLAEIEPGLDLSLLGGMGNMDLITRPSYGMSGCGMRFMKAWLE
jgi:hypothetical protein